MISNEAPIWYDGQSRDRAEVIALVRRDALAFLGAAVERFEAGASEWRVLVEDLYAGLDPGADDESTGATMSSSSWEADALELTPPHHFRHLARAIHARIATRPWCLSSSIRSPRTQGLPDTISITVGRINPVARARMGSAVESEAEALRAKLESGVAALVAVVAPDPMLDVAAALDDALRRVTEIEAAKRARIERFA